MFILKFGRYRPTPGPTPGWWQPISTAPRETRILLLVSEDDGPEACIGSLGKITVVSKDNTSRIEDRWTIEHSILSKRWNDRVAPTHWLPLPDTKPL